VHWQTVPELSILNSWSPRSLVPACSDPCNDWSLGRFVPLWRRTVNRIPVACLWRRDKIYGLILTCQIQNLWNAAQKAKINQGLRWGSVNGTFCWNIIINTWICPMLFSLSHLCDGQGRRGSFLLTKAFSNPGLWIRIDLMRIRTRIWIQHFI